MFKHVCLKEGYDIIFKTSGMGRAVKKPHPIILNAKN